MSEDARRLLLAAGCGRPGEPLESMVRTVIEQRDKARRAVRHLWPRFSAAPYLHEGCPDCQTIADLVKGE
jgi:hypothetical protein